ncbi:MAG: tRNA lysidine(34) synthetase TilS [Pseudomonadota bacterium]|nr:tRNA lysidine(34) synthetase TilS [Pseudomonadota bacterium]MEE2820532.1 tRNA lysidine(34) synthetase TilS [Pseudomonadota bacterium]
MSVVTEGLIQPHWPGPDHRVHLMISGGADSMALLALVADFSKMVMREVIIHHCDHGVAAEARDWLQFVKTETERRGFAFKAHHLNLELGPEFEVRARSARYDAVMSEVEKGDVVMTAHHRDDQIETLLIRLSQGSGLIGLTGIPVTRPFGLGVLVRPLLSVARHQLRQVLAARNLRHVVDPSNQDPSYLRNYIRLQFLPALSRVAPAARDQLLQLSKVATEHIFRVGETLGEHLPVLGIDSVAVASTPSLISWQVRFFAQAHGRYAPSAQQISEFARQCLDAANDRLPEVLVGEDVAIRKWGNRLYWVNFKTLGEEAESEITRMEKIDPNQLCELRFPNGVLSLSTGAVSEEVAVFWGVKGRSFRLGRKRPMRSLKQLAQTLGLPPWLRQRTPLIAISDQIIGWGAIDCRDEGLVPRSLQWQWRFLPRNTTDSNVS